MDPNTGISLDSNTGIDPDATGIVDPNASVGGVIDPWVVDPLTGLSVTGNVYGNDPTSLDTLNSLMSMALSGSQTIESNRWDGANRLIGNTNYSGDQTTYGYDGDSNRVSMSVTLGTGTKQSNYPSTNPAGMRDGWEPQYKKQQMDIYFTNDITLSLPEPLMATDASGNKWKQSYVYGAGGERISMSYLPSADASTDWEPTPGASEAAGNTTPKTLFYMSDVRGSAIGLLGADGRVSARYHYDEFGVSTDTKKFDLNWAGPDNLFGYTGLGYDFNSGYSYARARYIDSEVGRFISVDTYEGDINNPQSLNLYTYVSSNPLRYTDPSGHKVWLIHGTFSGGETWTPDFVKYVEGLFQEKSEKLNWSGDNSTAARSEAAEDLFIKILLWHRHHPRDPVRIIGHSHGGNVAILITNLLSENDMEVETLITVATPVRGYKLKTSVGQHIQLYNTADAIQENGGSIWSLLNASRVFRGAENVKVDKRFIGIMGSKSSSAHFLMHSNAKVWKEYIEPILRLKE